MYFQSIPKALSVLAPLSAHFISVLAHFISVRDSLTQSQRGVLSFTAMRAHCPQLRKLEVSDQDVSSWTSDEVMLQCLVIVIHPFISL